MSGAGPNPGDPLGAVEEWRVSLAGGLDLPALIILSIGIGVSVFGTWRSLDPAHPLKIRLGIICLRTLALLAAFGILLQPTLHFRKVKERPGQLAILVDVSGSMARGKGGGRLAEARRIATEAARRLARMSGKYHPVWYRFAGDLVPSESPEKACEPLQASYKTDLKGALGRLVENRGAAPFEAVVIVSDGADTEIKPAREGVYDLAWIKDFRIPVNTVLVGDKVQRTDLSVERATVDPFAFSRSETPIKVSLRSVGIPDREVEAFLWQDGQVVQRRTAQLVGGRGQVTFTVFPSALGQQVLTATVPVPPGDEVPENNRAHLSFEVVRDKYRILHLAGQPSWDQRFLRSTLNAWPRVDLVSFYILRTAYQSTHSDGAGVALIPFPTEDLFEGHLEEFDVLIFHNFDPAAVGVDRYLDKIAGFVKAGGAIALIGAASGFGGGKSESGALKDLLPVVPLPSDTPQSRLSDDSSYSVRLTAAGAEHPMMRQKASAKKNAEYWSMLGRLDGITRVASIAEGGLRLAEHPFITADDGPAPVVAVKEAGKGRSLVIATDALWRWRFSGPMVGGPQDAYTEFWRRAIAWLTRSPELDRLRVDIDPSAVSVGEPIRFDISLLDEAYRPVPGVQISADTSWILEDGARSSDRLTALLDDQGRYRREWVPSAEGPHLLTVTAADGTTATRRFLVRSRDAELNHLEPVPSLLKAVSEATGGRYAEGVLEIDKLRTGSGGDRQVLSHADDPLWDHPAVILLFLSLLFGEWMLRRRVGLR